MKKVWGPIVLSATLLLAACGGDESSTGEAGASSSNSGDTYKIGTVYPITGNLALLGGESFKGVEMAVEEINENGGIDGKQIKLVNGDATDTDAAQSEVNRLISKEDIEVIVGTFSSGLSTAASEVAERNGALFAELGAVADSITDRGYKSVVRTNPAASFFSVQHMKFIEEVIAPNLGKDVKDLKIAIAHEDSSYGTTIAVEAEKIAKEKGYNIVSIQSYSSTSNDLSPVILNLKKAEPDVVIAVSYINDAVLLANQSKELGFDPPVIIGSGGGHTLEDFKDAVGDLSEGIFNIDFPQFAINTEFTPGLEEFVAAYEEKYGKKPSSGHSLANYMGFKVIAEAIDNAGTTDPAKVREELLKIKEEPGTTVTGWGVDFDEETGQNKAATTYVMQWINGEHVTVWPEESAVAEPVFK